MGYDAQSKKQEAHVHVLQLASQVEVVLLVAANALLLHMMINVAPFASISFHFFNFARLRNNVCLRATDDFFFNGFSTHLPTSPSLDLLLTRLNSSNVFAALLRIAAERKQKIGNVCTLNMASSSAKKELQVLAFSITKLTLKKVLDNTGTVFENHRKSLIQHCERSELRLYFEWAKVN